MFYSNRLLVLILVTVFSKSAWCASLTHNIGAASGSPRSVNGVEREGKQLSNDFNSANIKNNGGQNANLGGGVESPQSSSFSITPSFSYQYYTNDNEHLDNIVSAHPNSPASGIDRSSGSISGTSSSGVSSRSSVTKDIPSSAETVAGQRRSDTVSDLSRNNISYAGFDFSAYQNQQNQAWSDGHRIRGDWVSKQKQHFLSTPTAISQENYLSHGGQVRDIGRNGTRNSYPPSPTQPITIKNEETRNNSTLYAYSHPPKNHQTPNGTPITYQGQQPNKVHTAGSYSYKDTNTEQTTTTYLVRSMPVEGEKSTFAFSEERKRPAAKRKILQSRADTYVDEGASAVAGATEEEDAAHLQYYDHGDEQYAPEQAESYDHDHDHEHDHHDNQNEYYYGHGANGQQAHDDDPALRDFGKGEGGLVPIGIGAGVPGPPGLPPPGFPPILPPPPGPLKGSIDYILIPLILIGLSGPIFVVLYVILGGFEYRLAPITRSFKSSYADYQPYINTVTSSVGKALEQYECFDYSTCRLRGFCNQVGLDNATTSNIETAMSFITPKEYKSAVDSLFSLLMTPPADQDCSQYKCSSIVDKLPINL